MDRSLVRSSPPPPRTGWEGFLFSFSFFFGRESTGLSSGPLFFFPPSRRIRGDALLFLLLPF